MNAPTSVSQPIYNFLPTDIEGFDSLAELALNMCCSWNHATDTEVSNTPYLNSEMRSVAI
jgi:hypothetical protein